jgi:acetamidase/formamidase/AraC-like DNA-binding protein
VLDAPRHFSTEAFPEVLRQPAWAEVLANALMANEAPASGRPALDGYVSSRNSMLGSAFMNLRSSPQVLVPHPGNAHRAGHSVLALALIEGRGSVAEGGNNTPLAGGDLVLLDPARGWRVELATPFRAVVVKLESASFILRLVRTCGQDASTLSSRAGVGAVCLNLVRTIADELGQLTSHDLLPIEATLGELLVTCLLNSGNAAADESTSVQLGHLRRVCRSLEARLGDAELGIEQIARLEGLSTRYIQKLFQVSATTFGEYLKSRRLERCRIDLANRALGHFTIAELCFRWGFGDAANFSRAFTARFGVSPKAFRAEPPTDIDAPAQAHRGRPMEAGLHKAGRRPGGPPAPAPVGASEAHPHRSDFQQVLGDHARYVLALALAPKRAVPAGAGSHAHHHYLPASDKTVHWGYFSRALKPVMSVRSGDVVTIETLTQHASDDRERMIEGDPGAESVFRWTADHKGVERRGAGPMDASTFGRGAGEGFGVHICTGPVYVHGAEPGDVLEIRILDIRPRPSCSPRFHGKVFGSNAAAWWGYQYNDLITEPKKREVVTVYEIDAATGPEPFAKAVYNFRWTPQTDPYGVRHDTIDYPGVPVDHTTVDKRYGVLANARVPIRPHFGVLAVAPKESGLVDSVPPAYFGGNLDNWRAGKGAKLFLPVAAEGALFSVGDPHASQGDSEVCGTAIECSLTGVFQLVLHKRQHFGNSFLADLSYPFLETDDAWVLQGFSFANHLAELGPEAQAEVYKKSSLDLAMRDAFRKARRYLMQAHGLDEDEAVSLISVAVDFGVTQVVDGNWGVHAIIRKAIFPGFDGRLPGQGG